MLSDLAFGIAERGADVSVVTSRLRYSGGDDLLPKRERISGVETIRMATSNFGRHGLLLRAIDYLTFYISAIFALLRILRAGDVLVAMTDPPMLAVIAVPIARLRGARVIVWSQDLFPEVAEALSVFGSQGRTVFSALRFIRNASHRRADMNVVIGELMANRLAATGAPASRISVIPNWADCKELRPVDGDRNPLRDAWGLKGCFVVGYSGNLGRAHDVETLLSAAALIEARNSIATWPAIRWLFIGGGHLFSEAAREADARGLRSVSFQPYQPRQRLPQSLGAADVHLVILRPELEGLIVPSKFYGIAAAGRASIFIGAPDGEIARVIRQHKCGLHVQMGDAEALANAVLQLMNAREETKRMGERARLACEAYYDKAHAIRSWASILGLNVSGEPSDQAEQIDLNIPAA
ncbi:glycosyltransferase family 4 protein [Hyphomicrobium methylovorum]|uniref:glycosyltransferase family 4 protein n=1 Tax=Hyphomicrobium methylovorum TaxID=84 RepID=UPI001AED4AA1|nr:glycosyltransferase family 4 protein [Hyphomicrobium methylovorum]